MHTSVQNRLYEQYSEGDTRDKQCGIHMRYARRGKAAQELTFFLESEHERQTNVMQQCVFLSLLDNEHCAAR